MDIMQLDDDLIYFFNNVEINLYDGGTKIDLLYWFPILKQGISYRSNIKSLLLLYINYNNLREGIFINLDEPLKKLINSLSKDVITIEDIEVIITAKTTKSTKQLHCNLYDESNLLPRNLFDFSATPISDFYSLLKKKKNLISYSPSAYILIESHPKVNRPYLSIIFKSIQYIERIIDFHDCRSNNFRAYYLSLERDENITKLVIDNILIRIFLHREILKQQYVHDNIVNALYSLMLEIL